MLFKDIIGHTDLKNRLINTVLNQRISHAQLFLGKEGSEKLALAIAYSQFISCTNKQIYSNQNLHADSCGKCPSCIKFQKLTHPDLHFVFPVATTKTITTKPTSNQFITQWREALIDSNFYLNINEWYEKIGTENKQGKIGVDDATQIIKTLALRSYESEYKIMIIWMVEKLYHTAAPKLLKILEEPPEKTLFILIAEDTNVILKTILSRTQLIKLLPLSDSEIKNYLETNFNFDESKITALINLAEGNFKNIIPILQNNDLTNPFLELFRNMMLLAYKHDFINMKKNADELSKFGRETLKEFIAYGIRIVRMCLYYSVGNVNLVKANGPELEFITKFSNFVNQNNAQEISEILNEASFHIERNVNQKITIMDTSLKISAIFNKK